MIDEEIDQRMCLAWNFVERSHAPNGPVEIIHSDQMRNEGPAQKRQESAVIRWEASVGSGLGEYFADGNIDRAGYSSQLLIMIKTQFPRAAVLAMQGFEGERQQWHGILAARVLE